MSLIALGSLKASPGVTTMAIALGVVWSSDRRVTVAELDVSGGDLAARYGLKQQPGLISLAAVGRREQDASVFLEHRQPLGGQLDVLVGPPSAEHARTAMLRAAKIFAGLDQLNDVDILADLGRIDVASPNWSLLGAVSLTVIVVRPVLSELQHLAGVLDSLRESTSPFGIVLLGDGPYKHDEIERTLGVDVLGTLPNDPATASAMNSGTASLPKLNRSPLIRAARTLVSTITDHPSIRKQRTSTVELDVSEVGA